MRLSFDIMATHGSTRAVKLFDAVEASQPGAADVATLVFTAENGLEQVIINGRPEKHHKGLMARLAKAVDAAQEEATANKLKLGTSILLVCRALLARGAVQLAYDSTAKRYRCVSTMKEGANVYELVGTGGLTVEAKDEETAVRLGKREVTEQMQATPEQAGKLVGFFTGGCKVKEQKSGALPTYTMVSALASPAEIKLAATPVKPAPKSDEE